MALTIEQHQRLIDNLTTLRRQRLVFGFSAVSVTWQHRGLTPAEREWDLFPRPGKLWMPTLQRRDPLDVVLKK